MRVGVLLAPRDGAVPPSAAAVVIDVLRATSTLSAARAHGAARILPAASPEEAAALRRQHPGALLCGERESLKIPGFDLGNSPLEYDPARVAGRTLIFCSTNGSCALVSASRARRRLLGAFVNARAVIEALEGEREVMVVCAGNRGAPSLEDAACAGLLCERLERRGAVVGGGAARLARSLAPRDAAEVQAVVQGSAHGRELRALGARYAADVEWCAELDRLGGADAIELGG